jgi:hypothetical protein
MVLDGRNEFPLRKIGNSARRELRRLSTSRVIPRLFPPIVKEELTIFCTYT